MITQTPKMKKVFTCRFIHLEAERLPTFTCRFIHLEAERLPTFTCRFIHLEAERLPTSGTIIKEKAEIVFKNFQIKTKVSWLVKVGYIDRKLFTVSINRI